MVLVFFSCSDFDDDGNIGKNDIENVVNSVSSDKFEDDDINYIVKNVS